MCVHTVSIILFFCLYIIQNRILYTHIFLTAQFRIFSLFGNLADLLYLWTTWYESFNCLVSILFRFPCNVLFLCLCEKFNLLECSDGSLITGQQRQDTEYRIRLNIHHINASYQLQWDVHCTSSMTAVLRNVMIFIYRRVQHEPEWNVPDSLHCIHFWIVSDMKYADRQTDTITCPATCNSNSTLRTPRPSLQAALSCHGSWVRHPQLLVWSGVVPHWGLDLAGAGGAGGV